MSTSPAPPPGALRIGRVAGVPVFVDRTWLVLAVFVAWSGWQAGRDLGAGTAVAYAVWLVVGILVAVLGHEAGHALSARALGFRVHRIVATLMGGHTAYDGTGITPVRSAAIALAGPGTNLVLAAVGGVATASLAFPASQFAWSFTVLNLLLAGFNLLPGLPLDGGAALQALVWGVTGRRDRGYVVAGWAGRVVAVGIVVWFGVVPVLEGTADGIGIVLALLMGWILWAGATAAIRRGPYERLVSSVRVGEVAEPVTVAPAGATLGEARTVPTRVLALDEAGRPTLLLLEPPTDLPPETPLSAVLTRIPDDVLVEARPEDDLGAVVRAVAATGFGAVVLTHEGQAWGLATAAAVDAAARRVLGPT